MAKTLKSFFFENKTIFIDNILLILKKKMSALRKYQKQKNQTPLRLTSSSFLGTLRVKCCTTLTSIILKHCFILAFNSSKSLAIQSFSYTFNFNEPQKSSIGLTFGKLAGFITLGRKLIFFSVRYDVTFLVKCACARSGQITYRPDL
jgi:hypothetical protein